MCITVFHIMQKFGYLFCCTEIVNLVRQIPEQGEEPFRPNLQLLQEVDEECPDYIMSCMQDCWADNPELRPDFLVIRSRLKKMKEGM